MKFKQDKTTYFIAPTWLGLALILCLALAGLGYYYYDQSDTNKRTKARVGASIKKRQSSISTLNKDFSDAKTEQLRQSTTKIKEAMQTGAEVDSFIASLRPVWSVVSRSEEPNEEYIRRRYQIARGSFPVSAWPEIIGLVGRMAEQQSLALTNVDISTVGDNNKREFSRVALSFTIYVKKPE